MWKIYDFFEGRFLAWPYSALFLEFPTEEMAHAFIVFNLLDEDHRYAPLMDASILQPNACAPKATSEDARSANQPRRR